MPLDAPVTNAVSVLITLGTGGMRFKVSAPPHASVLLRIRIDVASAADGELLMGYCEIEELKRLACIKTRRFRTHAASRSPLERLGSLRVGVCQV